MEQYKLYVEMADRVSSRRATANMFFLTLNTAIVALIGSAWESGISITWQSLLFPTFALVSQCLTWFWIIRSYRQLNTIKWAVVGAMEKHLPLLPYSDAEWEAAARGKEPAIYWPLSKVESIIPFLFGATYIGSYLILIIKG